MILPPPLVTVSVASLKTAVLSSWLKRASTMTINSYFLINSFSIVCPLVEFLHCFVDSVVKPHQAAFRGRLCHVFQFLRFFPANISQHVIGGIFSLWVSHADAQARKIIIAQMFDHRTQSVVPAVGSLGAEAQLPEGELKIVRDHKNVLQRDLFLAHHVPDGDARMIHERLRH